MLALAALFPATVFAQSSVKVYGSIDAGVRYQTNVDAAGNGLYSMASGHSFANRLGFRGQEDLGGGMNAHFQLESGFNTKTGELDNANNVLFNRTAAVGIGGKWGSIDLGRQYTIGFRTEKFLDPFDHHYTGMVPFPRAPARPCRPRPKPPASAHPLPQERASIMTCITPAHSAD